MVKKERNIDIWKEKTREVPDILKCMFKEEERDNNLSIQQIRENFLTVDTSMNAKGAKFGPLFDSVVKDQTVRGNTSNSSW